MRITNCFYKHRHYRLVQFSSSNHNFKYRLTEIGNSQQKTEDPATTNILTVDYKTQNMLKSFNLHGITELNEYETLLDREIESMKNLMETNRTPYGTFHDVKFSFFLYMTRVKFTQTGVKSKL
jgi:hypothetical protein